MRQAGYPNTCRLALAHGLVPGGEHRLRRASRGGRRDRHRAQQRARVLLPRHDPQRALRPDGQPVRARPLGRRQLGRRAPARSRSVSASWRSAPTAAARSAFPRRSAARRVQAHLRPRAARARRRRLAAADAFRAARPQRRRLRARARRDGGSRPARPALACPRSATTTSRPRASPATSRGLRVAASDDLGYIRLDREVRERFAEAVAAFARGDRRDGRVGASRPRLAARGLERDRVRRQQCQRGAAARRRPRRRRRARADRGGSAA